MDEKELQEGIEKAFLLIKKVKEEVSKKIVGQNDLVDSLLISLFGGGHVLVEGVPGLAKTLAVNTLSKALDLGFSRIQFTPDLLPSDLIGTEIFNSKISSFEIKKGPVFNNFILADEINRAPSKVQSALLEAMAEKHITIGKDIFKLDEPFIVLATQNPIEQSGTYNLPEAELDRFMLKVKVTYPLIEEEKEIYKRNLLSEDVSIKKVIKKSEIFWIQSLINEIFISDSIFEYVMNIIDASRYPEKYGMENLKKYITYGASPRAGLALLKGAKVNALFEGRNFVIPEDVKKLVLKVLGHRIVLSYEAVADDITEEFVIKEILNNVKVV